MITIEKLDPNKCIAVLESKDSKREHLGHLAHKPYLDMQVILKQVVDANDEGMTTRTIDMAELEDAGISLDELYDIAVENTKERMQACVNDFMGLLVLTNDKSLMGATSILYADDLLKETAEKNHSDLLIIPSSIHEVLLFPDNGCFTADDLRSMICDVNSAVVEDRDILSDHAYLYKRATGEITFAS